MLEDYTAKRFVDWLTNQRAKYYLNNTHLPVNRIAALCGYENDVHFIRQFKSRSGMTAGEYRKKHKTY